MSHWVLTTVPPRLLVNLKFPIHEHSTTCNGTVYPNQRTKCSRHGIIVVGSGLCLEMFSQMGPSSSWLGTGLCPRRELSRQRGVLMECGRTMRTA